MRKKINWKKIWNDFDIWCGRSECKTCGHSNNGPILEDLDREKITKLIKTQLKEIRMSNPLFV